jgi:hypothetical protein
MQVDSYAMLCAIPTYCLIYENEIIQRQAIFMTMLLSVCVVDSVIIKLELMLKKQFVMLSIYLSWKVPKHYHGGLLSGLLLELVILESFT